MTFFSRSDSRAAAIDDKGDSDYRQAGIRFNGCHSLRVGISSVLPFVDMVGSGKRMGATYCISGSNLNRSSSIQLIGAITLTLIPSVIKAWPAPRDMSLGISRLSVPPLGVR